MSVAMIKRIIKANINLIRMRKQGNEISTLHKVDLKSSLIKTSLAAEAMVASGASINESSIGRYTSIGRNTKITHAEIGNFCAISWDCTINAIFHPIDHPTISAFPYVPYVGGFVKKRKQNYSVVVVGNDVWIGAGAVIMPGIKIGDGSIIGAGSIVTKDVESYSIVAGNPARKIRSRFSEDIILKMNDLKWWGWDDAKIAKNIDFFSKENSLKALAEIL